MDKPTNYTDADRDRLATRHKNTMVGPTEVDRCQHGKFYSYRWKWSVGGSPEDGDAEIVSQNCEKCSAD